MPGLRVNVIFHLLSSYSIHPPLDCTWRYAGVAGRVFHEFNLITSRQLGRQTGLGNKLINYSDIMVKAI